MITAEANMVPTRLGNFWYFRKLVAEETVVATGGSTVISGKYKNNISHDSRTTPS